MRTYKDRKTGRHYVDYFFGGRRVRYPAGDSKREADQLKSRITLEINAGVHDPEQTKRAVKGKDGGSVDFETVVAEFLREYMPRGGSIRYYMQRSKIWLRFFGRVRIADIKTENVLDMLRTRQNEVGDSTARKDVVSLGTFFKWARRKGYIFTNPADSENVKRPAEPFDPQEVRWLSDENLACLKAVSPLWLRGVIT